MLHALGLVRTTPLTWEALVAAVIDSSAFNGHMSPIARGRVTAKVAEMPGFVYISLLLLLCNLASDDQSDDAKVDTEFLCPTQVFPLKIASNAIATCRWSG